MVKNIHIKEGRVDDIKAARDAWNADFNKRKADYDAQYDRYTLAQEDFCDNIILELRNRLGVTEESVPELAINVDLSKRSRHFDYSDPNRQYHIGVQFEYASNSRGANAALRWHIGISLDDDGSVLKDSGSWSGLDVVTPEKLSDLKRSVNLIEQILDLDWQEILSNAEASKPNRKDYFTLSNPYRTDKKPDFENQLTMAIIEDAIGTDTLIRCSAPPSSGLRSGTSGYCKIISETPAQYKLAFVPMWDVEAAKSGQDVFIKCGVKKELFINRLVKRNDDGEPVTEIW